MASNTVEWAMAELLHNPENLKRTQTEIRAAIGKIRPVQESDISSLPCLQTVMKETFWLHAPAPLLHCLKAELDAEKGSFVVPKNAQILINVWAIGRNPNAWPNPELFLPERFLDRKIDFRGQDFELTPFGAGRRICPGLPLAYRMVHLMLASLLLSFDWKLEEGMRPEDVDMSENFGFTLQMAIPPRAVPVKA